MIFLHHAPIKKALTLKLAPSIKQYLSSMLSMMASTPSIMTIFPIARCPGQWKLNGAIRFAPFAGNADRLRANV